VLCGVGVTVTALQWTTASIDGGGFYYPGQSITISFQRMSDVRIDNGMADGSNLTLLINGTQAIMGVPPGEQSDYCDSCIPAPPVKNVFTVVDSRTGYVFGTQTSVISACSFITIVVTGTKVRGATLQFVTDSPKYYQALFYTNNALPGAYAQTTAWGLPQPGDIGVDLFVPIPSSYKLNGYVGNAPLFINVSRADTPDADFKDPVLNVGIYPTPQFTLSAFFYGVMITNNNGRMGPGAIVQLSGSGMSVQTTYQCVWNNTNSGMLFYSSPGNPSSKSLFTCLVPDSLSTIANPGDSIELANVSLILTTTPYTPPGFVPVTSNTGGNPTWAWPAPVTPPPSPSSLSGGAIFGIILAILIAVTVLVYVGYRYVYLKRKTGDAYAEHVDAPTKTASSASQIQYNPSSYQSNNDNQPFQASGDNA